jgi:hypothetical protein
MPILLSGGAGNPVGAGKRKAPCAGTLGRCWLRGAQCGMEPAPNLAIATLAVAPDLY